LISGLTGLYRGIATNITSSAPISALYTFTYESIKGALLPLFPKVALFLVYMCVSISPHFVLNEFKSLMKSLKF